MLIEGTSAGGYSRVQVRSDWLQSVVTECQVTIGRAMGDADSDDTRALASALANKLRDPINPSETVLLNALLLEMVTKWGLFLHARAHGLADRPCQFDSSHTVEVFWSAGRRQPKQAIEAWARAFSAALLQSHPPTAAQQAASALRRQFAPTWNVPRLARAIGFSQSQLRRGFRREYDMTVGAYQRRVRVLRALELLANGATKIEPIALEVGYRSRKNFYRAFQRSTGLTPTQFRGLPRQRASDVIESARLSLAAYRRH
jgi:AraC-like DNA-binding protein